MAKMIDVTYYRMNNGDVFEKIFTDNARNQIYFRDEENQKLYFFQGEKKIYLPFAHNNSMFFDTTIALYPIGIEIMDTTNSKKCGTITQYLINEKKYVVKDKSNSKKCISFKNAMAIEYYYFISSSGKVQIDLVGRNEFSENFRKKTCNYFENKDDAVKKLAEIVK